MMTGRDVQKFRRVMQDELNAAPRLALKCAVMLLLIFGLALSGASDESLAGRGSPYPATQTAAHSERYGRTVFEERRRRYIEAHPDSHVACAPALVERAQ